MNHEYLLCHTSQYLSEVNVNSLHTEITFCWSTQCNTLPVYVSEWPPLPELSVVSSLCQCNTLPVYVSEWPPLPKLSVVSSLCQCNTLPVYVSECPPPTRAFCRVFTVRLLSSSCIFWSNIAVVTSAAIADACSNSAICSPEGTSSAGLSSAWLALCNSWRKVAAVTIDDKSTAYKHRLSH